MKRNLVVSTTAGRSLRSRSTAPTNSGFTLLELMVSMAVLAIIMALVFQMLGSTQRAWSAAKARTSVFREAREAFESMTRTISQATLNTYWDYERTATGIPLKYEKKSDLHFVCAPTDELLSGGGSYPGHAVFFQAPGGFSIDRENQGFSELLNAYGYFVQFDDGLEIVPSFLPESVTTRARFRLMEFRPPAEDLAIFRTDLNQGATSTSLDNWFTEQVNRRGEIAFSRPVAENILLLIIEPKESESESRNSNNTLAPDYVYDSRAFESGRGKKDTLREHVVPPILDVTMVAMDEASAVRYEQINGQGALSNLAIHNLFKSTSQYEDDLEQLEATLTAAKIDFRVFRETVGMKNSAWEAQIDIN